MENFVVSARKYRPKQFDEVVGQEAVAKTLQKAIESSHLAQAFLFCGPRGVGKTTCARILAKVINSKDMQVDNEQDFSFNIFELDAASNNSVDDIRNLTDQVRIPPQTGNYKVYIIDEAHMLSQQAFNAFLKTLEEPPKHAIFILATTEKHKIIPTILSRCQIFDFKRIEIDDIVKHLFRIAEKEGIKAEAEALHIIAEKADGALRDALSIFDQIVSFSGKELTYQDVITNLNILDYDYYFKIAEQLYLSDSSSALILFNDILSAGFDGHHFITGLAQHFRNILVAKDERTVKLLEVSDNVKQRFLSQAKLCSDVFLFKGLEILSKTDVNYKSAKNQRLLVEICLLQLANLLNEQVEKKNTEPQLKPQIKVPAKATPQEKKTSNFEEVAQHLKPEVKEEATREQVNSVSAEVNEPTENIAPKSTGGKLSQRIKQAGTFSIKDSLNEQNVELLEEVEEQGQQQNNPINEDELIETYKAFVEGLDKVQFEIAGKLLQQLKPNKKDDNTISIAVLSKLQESQLRDVHMDLSKFLQKHLKNDYLTVVFEVDEDLGSERVFDAKEIFQKMLEKNPAMQKLRDNLGLEMDI